MYNGNFMLLEIKDLTKTLGIKHLFQNLSFFIVPGEKVALIGRNGYGKTTLLKILSGEDHEYEGKMITRRNLSTTLTKQEHLSDTQQTPLEYILKNAPHYFTYKKVMDEYEQGINTNTEHYLEILGLFTENRYFHLPEAVLSTLADFGISNESANQPLIHLSGGEKRYVEMTKMMFSQSDLLLIDEPTNHMDYLGKERFISWMKSIPQAVLVVTHDRDVLKHVNKILELKDKKVLVFKGNYDQYIAQNANKTLTSVKLYTDQLSRLKEAKKKVEWGLQMRAKSKEWKTRYDHWLRDYEKLKAETVKPSFWIDQTSVDEMDKKVVDSYHKFKERNIKIAVSSDGKRGGELLSIRDLTLAYEEPVFTHVHFSLRGNDRVFIKGKNGAGKSTLIRTIMALSQQRTPKAKQVEGEIAFGNDVRIGEYEQEIDARYLPLPLEEAIHLAYKEKQQRIEEKDVKRLLAQYLFDPTHDGRQKVMELSGGQKARFQLIKMFVDEPNLLILDEPTNHLDLPSIEELEAALAKFEGGILYTSHDSYFIQKMGGSVVKI
jgi:ATP-binding cassette subfamily F protein 3